MSHWIREIAGWLLVIIGLLTFWSAYGLLLNKRVFEAGPAAFMGFVIFRGGIHLLKVAVAAQAARALSGSTSASSRRAGRANASSFSPTVAQSVIPGPQTQAASHHRR